MRSRPGEVPGLMVPPMTTGPVQPGVDDAVVAGEQAAGAEFEARSVDRAVVQYQRARAVWRRARGVAGAGGADADADEAGVDRRAAA